MEWAVGAAIERGSCVMEQNTINPMMEQLVLSLLLSPISRVGTVLDTVLTVRICRQIGLLLA